MSDKIEKPKQSEQRVAETQTQATPTAVEPSGEARRVEIPSYVDLGEHIVGSNQWHLISKPKLVNGYKGTGLMTGALHGVRVDLPGFDMFIDNQAVAAFSTQWDGNGILSPLFVSGNPSDKGILLKFSPPGRGNYQVRLDINVKWDDGEYSSTSILVTAKARHIEESPHEPLGDSSPATIKPATGGGPPDHEKAIDGVQWPLVARLAASANRSRTTAKALARRQGIGATHAKDETKKYKRATPSAPWWVDLAEIAVLTATGGLAGIVGRKASAFLVKKLASEPSRADFERILNDGIKDGFKATVKTARSNTGSKATVPPEEGGEYSSDAHADFFTAQDLMLADMAEHNDRSIDLSEERLQPLLATKPEAAISAMEAIEQALEHLEVQAFNEQMVASETHWLSGVARTAHGEESVRSTATGQERTVTKMENVGTYGAGVLTLAFKSDPKTGDFEIQSATLNGISQVVANQLARIPLAKIGIPLRFQTSVYPGGWSTQATRDEIGRVRVSGLGTSPEDSPENEASRIHLYTSMIDRLLGTSLVEKGIKIKTDDEKRT